MSLCLTCPHRKFRERNGSSFGYVPDNEVANVMMDGVLMIGDKVHPCHENTKRDCQGHLRDLQQLKEGTATRNHDVINYKKLDC
jgi:hypothetical protein